MRAMILAPGLGKRLRPITDTIPKPMIPVAGIPNILWTIAHLKRNGITEIAINLHHLPNVIETCLKDKNIDGLLIISVPQVMADPKKLSDRIIDLSKTSTKPILTSLPGEESVGYTRQLLNRNNVPTYAVVPSSTVDLSMSHGRLIPIEERDPSEVLNLQWNNKPITPKGTSARNPAFDITPHHLISAIVTENGIIKKPYSENLRKIVLGN